jgi:hypothetical protein
MGLQAKKLSMRYKIDRPAIRSSFVDVSDFADTSFPADGYQIKPRHYLSDRRFHHQANNLELVRLKNVGSV